MPLPQQLVKQRVMAAIRGAFVADAASMGTHWIYDPAEMIKTVTDVKRPEFRDPPSPNFYSSEEFPGHYGKVGQLSPYGEQLLFATKYTATDDDFGGETMSKEMLAWATTFGGRPDSALKAFQENMEKEDKSRQWPECGADDHQAHFYMKVVPVVCRFAGKTDLVEKVTQAIKVHQNNAMAIAFGVASARLLEAVVLGAPLQEALATVEKNLEEDLQSYEAKDDVKKAWEKGKKSVEEDASRTLDDILLEISHDMMAGKEDSPFYNLAGRSCALPGSFIGPIAMLYKYCGNENAYQDALRENILGSGDTCSRSVFIGAVLAAAGVKSEEGDGGVPKDWLDKVDATTLEEVNRAIDSMNEKLVSDS